MKPAFLCRIGFGNLTDKTPTLGSPPALHVAVTASNNHVVGYLYDANGNMNDGTYTYDVANRLVTMKNGNNPAEQYSYGPENQRVWKLQPDGSESLYFYGAFGELLGEYPIVPASAPTYYYPGLGTTRLYFAGKLINLRVEQRGEPGTADTGPAGLGGLQRWHCHPHALLSVGGGVHDDDAEPGEVRNLLPGQDHGPRLCAEPVLLEHPGEVFDGGPVPER